MSEPKNERWWEKGFDRLFIHENLYKSDDNSTAYTGVGNIKAFIDVVATRSRNDALKEAAEIVKNYICPNESSKEMQKDLASKLTQLSEKTNGGK